MSDAPAKRSNVEQLDGFDVRFLREVMKMDVKVWQRRVLRVLRKRYEAAKRLPDNQ